MISTPIKLFTTDPRPPIKLVPPTTHRRDDGQLKAYTRIWVRRAKPRTVHHRRQSSERAEQGMSEDARTIHWNTERSALLHDSRSMAIQMPAQRRLREQSPAPR